MLPTAFVLLLLFHSAAPTFYRISQALSPLLELIGVPSGPQCGACPHQDCRRLPAIVLGYCCGCKWDIDHIPIDCPPDLLCPPPISGRLCDDYNYLMECCCSFDPYAAR